MTRSPSLRRGVLLWLSVILLAFFAATVAALEWSLSASLARARAEVLEAQLIALMSVAEPDETGRSLTVPTLPDRRMATPESGLYGEIRATDGTLLWRSPSAIGLAPEAAATAARPGVREQRRLPADEDDSAGRIERSVTVAWEFEDGQSERFVFAVSQSLEPYRAQQRGFRVGLVSWFLGLMLATLVLLSLVLRRVLAPLGRIEREIGDIESGRRDALSLAQPAELAGVARNLNALLARERGRQQRYRDSLANLAHSLKTPLAAMQTVLQALPSGKARQALDDGIARMDRIVAYQLKRASAMGEKPPGVRPLAIEPLVEDLLDSLSKVYRDRPMRVQRDVQPGALFYGDEGDLMEILGNLLDNAWKYGSSRLALQVATGSRPGDALEITVEDDGPGLAPDLVAEVTARGTRLDQSQPGHGIGLAVVNDIVTAYGGSLALERSVLGGALLRVRLPTPG